MEPHRYQKLEQTFNAPDAKPVSVQNLVPECDPNYVPFGSFTDVKHYQVCIFYPIFVTGLSGNGKTLSIESMCSNSDVKLIRVNITIETDEDDLIGGFRLVNGETVFHRGPVVELLEPWSYLHLDELDLASNKIMCLQSVLEGKGVILKKVNELVKPAKGFQIFPRQTPKVRDLRMVVSSEPMFSTKYILEPFPVTFELRISPQ